MRISDWSSDVCSSDLVARAYLLLPLHIVLVRRLSGLPTSRLLLPMLAPLVAGAVMAATILALPLRPPFGPIEPWLELAMLLPVAVAVYIGHATCRARVWPYV